MQQNKQGNNKYTVTLKDPVYSFSHLLHPNLPVHTEHPPATHPNNWFSLIYRPAPASPFK